MNSLIFSMYLICFILCTVSVFYCILSSLYKINSLKFRLSDKSFSKLKLGTSVFVVLSILMVYISSELLTITVLLGDGVISYTVTTILSTHLPLIVSSILITMFYTYVITRKVYSFDKR